MNCVLLMLLMVSSVFSQELSRNKEKLETQKEPKDYRIGPGDVLSINIVGLYDRVLPVSNSGKVHIPNLGVITVTDMTPSQVQSEVSRRLRERDLVKDPWVHVRVVDYRARTVYILGEVQEPGQFQIRDEMYLTDLVALGLGFNEVTSPVIYLYRRNPGDLDTEKHDAKQPGEVNKPYEQALRIELKQLLSGEKPELNVQLTGGEVLYVPERHPEFYYVIGDVGKPGAISVVEGQKDLASQAISRAGGPTRTAKMKKGLVLRYDKDGTRQELAVDFDSILRGKKPDFPVEPNDVIYIPGSNAKTLSYGFLGVIPSIATSALVF
jgi:polysaccharide biosynthesis/export protein